MTHKIAFIGLGNMGGGMAANQAKAGHTVAAFDLSQAALDRAAAAGCVPVGSVAEAVKDADVVITMLPAGPHVLKVYSEQIIGVAPTTALLLDCSTIDVDTARKVAGLAKDAGYAFADTPVSGGTNHRRRPPKGDVPGGRGPPERGADRRGASCARAGTSTS